MQERDECNCIGFNQVMAYLLLTLFLKKFMLQRLDKGINLVVVKSVASYRSLASISFSSSSSSACFLRSLEDSLSTRSSSLSMSCRIFARAIVVLRARRRRAELVLYPDRPVRESSSGGGSGSVRFTFFPVLEGEPRP